MVDETFNDYDFFNSIEDGLSLEKYETFAKNVGLILQLQEGHKLLLHTTKNEFVDDIVNKGLDFRELSKTTDYLPYKNMTPMELQNYHLVVMGRKNYGDVTVVLQYNKKFFDYLENPEIYMKYSEHYGSEDLDQDEDELYYRTPSEFIKGYIDSKNKTVYLNKNFNPERDPSKKTSDTNNEKYFTESNSSIDGIITGDSIENKEEPKSKHRLKILISNVVAYLF